ncbi:hypothetical protein GP486_001054 [Trichoglossum hirsutum]|uniref:Uncharacterized protein n=1 Tax=Trichoglossum hirsutum TaxID=265104 RepID=A0A9P8RSZ4_9PEZI|nr:hypothetical protein GP486_001054 [Trichoglossum hirsutum]
MSLSPPFNAETAHQKVKAAQALWNTKDPINVALKGYTPDSIWRNRDKFLNGTSEIVEFLTDKWRRELDYRLRKELFAFAEDRIAVQFWSIPCSAVDICEPNGGEKGLTHVYVRIWQDEEKADERE